MVVPTHWIRINFHREHWEMQLSPSEGNSEIINIIHILIHK